MKAVVCTCYGPPDVLQIRDVPDPVAGTNEVVIRIHATAVTASEVLIRSGVPNARLLMRVMLRVFMGFRGPRRSIPGAILAGEIESIGSRVTRFRVGERVWAFTLMRCGCSAERICVPATMKLLSTAPSNLTHEEAAAIPYGGLLASFFLRTAKIQRGERVLVYGASGAIGTAVVQLAKHLGGIVTAVCSTANFELARSLGADSVLDYTKDEIPAGAGYDVVFDAVGRRKTSPMKQALSGALSGAGRYISVDDRLPRVKRSDLDALRDLAEAGALRPVIDRRYPLEQIADAHRYVELGHKKGNVVITVSPEREVSTALA